MKKEKSKLHIIGDSHNKKVLLIHGMGFYWEKCFFSIINELKKKYCLLIPELEGHNLDSVGEISSVYSSANNIIE
ncbi:hypothetical protein [Clostridium niameyense]|uniref:hypothetical protein n=1 Tax=Clostridium niameyense TaxID=1622073 RepID=UPI000B1E33F4|nr:hypothetical protein [Clostridium niameyense]